MPSTSSAPYRPAVAVHRLSDVRRWTAEDRAEAPRLIGIAPEDHRNPTADVPAPPGRAELSRLLRLVLEVLDRRRSERQLADWLPSEERRMLLREAETDSAGPWRLRSLRPSAPVPGVLEVCATVQVGVRTRAMVGRFELAGREWHCALLRMV
jgi:hypothetical protein